MQLVNNRLENSKNLVHSVRVLRVTRVPTHVVTPILIFLIRKFEYIVREIHIEIGIDLFNF